MVEFSEENTAGVPCAMNNHIQLSVQINRSNDNLTFRDVSETFFLLNVKEEKKERIRSNVRFIV